ncbi:hypothetical protein DXX93_10220 [Thalassotalea euphylliae]|uniref:TonB C-terminal domain-containing protein n=1 Tax=Thalassotalea euphylliae TaxID=1655234 RepID=A0A3E0TRF7_9GAMM|nr:hypothetical protein [Thalassotalea euphylliae]REL26907.1 hypothetical protein DXX93_10220 [Thalassotalea euphylliae]
MIQMRFMLLALVIVTGLMAILIINNRSDLTKPDTLLVQPLEQVAVLPPPPPPPTVKELTQPQTLKLDLRQSSQGPSLKLSKINIKLTKPQLAAPEILDFTPEFDSKAIAAALTGFALNELDQQPRLTTPLEIRFTSKMKGAGVKQVKVKLHVVIEIDGKVHLKAIKENPYPELNIAIKQLTKKARFTAPKRQGKAVRAEFIWPLVLKES